MKILVLGDVMGASGRNALNKKLPQIIKNYEIDFVIANGENSADDGRGITQEIAEEFFKIGVDVITSGNHIWDKQETVNFINKENSIKKFLKDKEAIKHFPAEGEGTLSGIIVETDTKTGLAKNVIRIIDGGSLTK